MNQQFTDGQREDLKLGYRDYVDPPHKPSWYDWSSRTL